VSQQVPVVSYLSLEDPPHLVATICARRGPRFFGKRLAGASCGERKFHQQQASRTGTLGSFSIIHRAAKGIPAPFASAIVDLDDASTVKANVVGCSPDPEHVRLGMPVELATFAVGTDDEGITAVAFGFTHVVGLGSVCSINIL
jgi:uncharacterized OB-fold protein